MQPATIVIATVGATLVLSYGAIRLRRTRRLRRARDLNRRIQRILEQHSPILRAIRARKEELRRRGLVELTPMRGRRTVVRTPPGDQHIYIPPGRVSVSGSSSTGFTVVHEG